MAAGWPMDVSYVDGDVYSASDVNDTNGTLNYIDPTSATDGQVLTRDNAAPGKVKWDTPVQPGLVLIKSQTIGTAVSSIAVTNAFSTTYDNYLIMVNDTVPSSNPNFLKIQLGATTTGYYGAIAQTFFSGATITGASDNNAAAWTFALQGNSTATEIQGSFTLLSPFLSRVTLLHAHRISTATAGAFAGVLQNTTSYTDFTLLVNTGTVTGGTIYVYGYSKV